MSGNDFEKQVQQKLGELKFSPSDAVWKEVEKKIKKRKDRKRMLLWLPLLFLLMSAGVWLYENNSTNNHTNTPAITKEEPAITKETPAAIKPATISTSDINKAAADKITKGLHKEPVHIIKDNQSSEKDNNNKEVSRANITGKQRAVANKGNDIAKTNPVKQKNGIRKNARPPRQHIAVNMKTEAGIEAVAKTGDQPVHENETIEKTVPEKTVTEKTTGSITPATDDKKKDDKEQNSDKIKEDTLAQEKTLAPVTKKADSIAAVAATKKTTPAKKKKIEWGIAATAGTSNFSNGFSELLQSSVSQNYFTAGNTNPSNSSVPSRPSDVKQGIAFKAGVTAAKRVTKTFSVFAGISYSYYSTRIQAGRKIDTTSVTITQANGQQQFTGTYYSNSGNTNYTNRYHFIEIPVGVVKQFGPTSRFSVNGGLSMAYLIGTNMLHYDSQHNIYYKDKSLLRSGQFNFFGGLTYDLLRRQKDVLQVGPQLQYGISNLFKDQASGNLHLFFVGVNAKLLFRKK